MNDWSLPQCQTPLPLAAKYPSLGGIIMFVLGNFIMAVAKLVSFLFDAYIIIIFARVVISWVNADPYNPIVRFLIQATEPLLYRIRRYIPSLGGLDLSPMILILAIIFLQSLLVPTLQQIGLSLR